MKTRIIVITLVAVLSNLDSSRCAEVAVESFPTTTEQVYYYVTGTLTNAKSQIPTSGGDKNWGLYDVKYSLSTSHGYSSEPCCDDKGTEGKKWKIPNNTIKVTVISRYQTVKVPEWMDRITCSSANGEWSRWKGDVAAHEWRHDSDYKSYLGTKSNYDKIVKDKEPILDCSQISEADAKKALTQEFDALTNALGAEISAGLNKLADKFHKEPGRPNKFPELNHLEDCRQ